MVIEPEPTRAPWYRRVPAWTLYALGALLVAALVPLSVLLTAGAQDAEVTANTANGRRESVESVAAPLAGGVDQVCRAGGEVASQLKAKNLCQQASTVASVIEGPPGPTGPAGPGPSQEQINAAVAAYLAVHPPQDGTNATPAMVAAAVAAYLTANPPQPGRPPTQGEIAAATNAYLTAHPDSFTGPAGKDATDAQVQSAVQAYCSNHGGCAGATGPTGSIGPTGPVGPTGPSGPPCDDQHHQAEVTAGLPPTTFLACVDNA